MAALMTTATRTGPVKVLPPGADRDDWLKARRDGIGASEIAAVMGISPWESPFSAYWRKVEGWQAEVNAEMSAGTRAEPVIADWWAEECDPLENLVIRPAGLYQHPERPWQLATPDRLVFLACDGCDGTGWEVMHEYGYECEDCGSRPPVSLVECKYEPHGWEGYGEPGTDQIPVYYRAQGLWQADVMGVDRVHFAAWHGAEFREYLVRRDETDLTLMREAGRRFWARVQDQDPPDLDGHSATLATLKRLHPSVEDIDIQVPVEFAEGYRRARAAARRAAALVDRYEARARQILGNGRRLLVGKQLVVSRSVYDQSGDSAELMAIDGEWPTVDRLNPGRAKSYV
jgi:putative phage-type endonuclease